MALKRNKTKTAIKTKKNFLTGRTKSIRTTTNQDGTTSKNVTIRRKSGTVKKVKTKSPGGAYAGSKGTTKTKTYKRDGSLKKTKTVIKGSTRGESAKITTRFTKDGSKKIKAVNRKGRLSDGTKSKRMVTRIRVKKK